MKIYAVTVCVNYSDFLAHTLPHNKQLFDRYVVVTDRKDWKTKKLCDHYNVHCVQTDVFYDDDHTLNKGKGINEGLKHMPKDGWYLHLDADIWLPPLTREILHRAELDPATLYGIDRMMCPNHDEWIKYKTAPEPINEGWVFVHPTAFPVGVRIAQYKGEGYLPIGFFQLWNPASSGIWTYPEMHGAVDRSDVVFAKRWKRSKRGFIPEVLGIHLDSEDTKMGTNWSGRKSAEFGRHITIKNYRLPWWKKKGWRILFIALLTILIIKIASIR